MIKKGKKKNVKLIEVRVRILKSVFGESNSIVNLRCTHTS